MCPRAAGIKALFALFPFLIHHLFLSPLSHPPQPCGTIPKTRDQLATNIGSSLPCLLLCSFRSQGYIWAFVARQPLSAAYAFSQEYDSLQCTDPFKYQFVLFEI
jgi:hypothetical protein